MSSGVRAVVAGHGGFAAGVVSAVEQITGRRDVFAVLDNRDLGAAEIEQALRRHVAAGARVVFTDLPAGSVTLAARRVLRDHPDLSVVTGANVAALLEFAFAVDAADAAAARSADRGREAIAVHGGAAGAARAH